ncbi:5-carboxymethyl-2-hydroxymuconate Delta-isomerase [Pseudoalteromonas luteoviolacea]|uniref:5-carboxymethyl-2-hydroxymuconate isomerase n=1 Tax=Pseudoalteromonas luteoviolacea DSM 6061 TaxID=1365250 RepID=A0A166XIM3_9GAMM|nr:5-carboxymethyl-2-hydroxymuconate Delta-isomerase [Pseudoalteromonas luteoviolacea]KZN40421.1 hypothetical protein N475_11630 [Pseudoalteromonas luteoviolacea DSM 6061]KZN53182.1 hypothetical protein N474_21910 [Pseudoalteromonas luteoviolacea CPMOR-2]MBE0387289.1 5-carboxymethyl-2-hydroxymuconate isomerase [Pseudoalteromonas luteoviolacea DSM 6061]TQF72113.1 5-carboxymethyl-2-hydroxymuconate Delta-isomerase [Pseudoalteromonas luteoviolacea]
MPHIIIEHSPTLQIDASELLSSVHQSVIDSTLFDITTIKTRLIEYQACLLGDGKKDFVHVQIHLLEGRTQAQKQILSELVLARLQHVLSDSVSLSVHPYDLDPTIYRKN